MTSDAVVSDFGDGILVATADCVILRGRKYTAHAAIDCVVRVPRDIYLSAVAAWIDEKARYSATYGGGVGSLVFSDLTPRIYNGTGGAPAFDAGAFAVDMERG
jgi:hypothetical protein